MAEYEQTVEDLLEGMMTELGDPSPSQLKPTLAWQKLLDAIQFYLNQLSVTTKSFLLAKVPINIREGIEDYSLNINDYGEGLFADITPKGSLPGTERAIVPVVDATLQSLSHAPAYSQEWLIYRDAGVTSAPGNPTGNLKLRVRPIPVASYAANLWYKPSRLRIEFLDDDPRILNQFYPNVRKRAALSALPHCDYSPQKKADIAGDDRHGLIKELNDGDALFAKYIMHYNDVPGEKRPQSGNWFDDGW